MNEDKSTRYHRLRRRASISGTALGIALLIAFVLTGASAALRAYAGSLAGSSFVVTLSLYVVILTLINEAISLPFAFYQGVTLERRYGLSTQTTARWWIDHLKAGLVALANRAGARVMGVFEWRLSDKTRKANAALAGIGQTRRIIISDTLLSEHSDDEIEVILAHELAHHVHRDIWKGIALETGLIALGFYLADRVLTRFAASFGLMGKGDIAALPLLVLAAGAVSLALMPLANALSRAHERRADRYALEMTKNVPAFVSAMKRLGAQNLAEEHPSRLVQILFYTHPPISARIDAAQAWAKSQ